MLLSFQSIPPLSSQFWLIIATALYHSPKWWYIKSHSFNRIALLFPAMRSFKYVVLLHPVTLEFELKLELVLAHHVWVNKDEVPSWEHREWKGGKKWRRCTRLSVIIVSAWRRNISNLCSCPAPWALGCTRFLSDLQQSYISILLIFVLWCYPPPFHKYDNCIIFSYFQLSPLRNYIF